MLLQAQSSLPLIIALISAATSLVLAVAQAVVSTINNNKMLKEQRFKLFYVDKIESFKSYFVDFNNYLNSLLNDLNHNAKTAAFASAYKAAMLASPRTRDAIIELMNSITSELHHNGYKEHIGNFRNSFNVIVQELNQELISEKGNNKERRAPNK